MYVLALFVYTDIMYGFLSNKSCTSMHM